MKTTIYTLFSMLTLCSSAQSQSPAEWSQQHPEVLLIETQDASPELLNRLDESSALYIVYTDELLMEDIEYFIQERPASGIAEMIDPTLDESEYVKMWLSQHPDIKIIRKSYYDSLDSEKQTSYNSGYIIILYGEFITYSDIEKFEDNRSFAAESGIQSH